MRPGHFAALLARARGRVTTIRPHTAARYAWPDAAVEAAIELPERPDIGPPHSPPRTPVRAQFPAVTPPAIPADRPAPPAAPAAISHSGSPARPVPQARQPGQRPAPPHVGADWPTKPVPAPRGRIADKPAPTNPFSPAPAPASTAPPINVTAHTRQPSPSPAIGQTRAPSPAADTPAEVHLHIGRIEVFAPPPQTPAGHPEPRRPALRPLSLDDYLAGRRGS